MLAELWSHYCFYLEVKYSLRRCIGVSSLQGVDLWWSILCVNLTRIRDAQIAGHILFLDVSVRVSLEEISIWVCRLSKEDHLHQWGVHHLIQLGLERNRKVEEEWIPLPSSSAFLIRFSSPGSQASAWDLNYTIAPTPFSGLWIQSELHCRLSWVTSLQTADPGSSESP